MQQWDQDDCNLLVYAAWTQGYRAVFFVPHLFWSVCHHAGAEEWFQRSDTVNRNCAASQHHHIWHQCMPSNCTDHWWCPASSFNLSLCSNRCLSNNKLCLQADCHYCVRLEQSYVQTDQLEECSHVTAAWEIFAQLPFPLPATIGILKLAYPHWMWRSTDWANQWWVQVVTNTSCITHINEAHSAVIPSLMHDNFDFDISMKASGVTVHVVNPCTSYTSILNAWPWPCTSTWLAAVLNCCCAFCIHFIII